MASLSRRFFSVISAILLAFVSFFTSAKDFVVVIDAGHGGHDIGAPGRSVNEEDVNLAVALELGNMIKNNCKGTKVVYTRSDDHFINLNERPRIANNANGDLFISIHCNSVERNRRSAAGAFVYVPGKTAQAQSLEVVRRENGDMGMEPDSEEVQMMNELLVDTYMGQSLDFASFVLDELVSTAGRLRREVRAADFRVLRGIQMPAVLVELDYICNPDIEKFLATKGGQKKLAMSIYNGLCHYMAKYNISSSATPIVTVATTEQETQEPGVSSNCNQTTYRVQFMTSSTLYNEGARQFKGLSSVEHYVEDGIYKYVYGNADSMSDASQMLRDVRKKFPDAFIIKMCDGKRVK